MYDGASDPGGWRADRGLPAVSSPSGVKVPADGRALVAVDLGAESCRVSLPAVGSEGNPVIDAAGASVCKRSTRDGGRAVLET